MIVDYSGDLFTVALLISSPAGHLWLIHSRHVVCTGENWICKSTLVERHREKVTKLK